MIEPHVFVIFGATGDLTRRKLVPALYRLMEQEDVAAHCHILGAARTDWSDADFRAVAREALRDGGVPEDDVEAWCTRRLFYQCLGPNGDDFGALRRRIDRLERHLDLPGNRVFYLSLPPSVYAPTIDRLGTHGLHEGAGWTRLVVEKPFGHDLASAQDLNARVHDVVDEEHVYRIDHYLGKETVQNLLVFRFGNALFESVWDRDHIERVEITVAEDLGAGGRAGYYDQAGHLRDMVQNHLTQLLTLCAMEPPARLHADAIRDEKVKVLHSVKPLGPGDAVFGQYAAGTVGGEAVPGYQGEEDVPPDSATETFVALRLEVGTWRWQGVPFYLRTGKRLPRRLTQIAVHFRRAPVALFGSDGAGGAQPNVLVMTLQPGEGFALRFEVKAPNAVAVARDAQRMPLVTQRLSFSYEDAFGPIPDAYQTLLRDVLTGDQTLFVRADEVEASWRLYASLLGADDRPVHPYPAGTWGPEAVADRLLANWTEGA